MTNDTRDYLSRVIYKLCGNHPDHDDMVQETMILAFRNKDKFRAEASYNTWLYIMAQNAISKWFEKANAKKRSAKIVQLNDNATYAIDFNARLQVEEVIDHLNTLDDTTARMFWQYYAEGMSEGEIAKHHGVKINTAKSKIHRAKKSLTQSA